MGYAYTPEAGVPDETRRVVREQVDGAVEDLTAGKLDLHEGVHEARKRFKKIRAVLRLVRSELGEDVYAAENVFFRDLGRTLSGLRDSEAMIEAFDALVAHFGRGVSAVELGRARNVFTQRQQALLARREALSQRVRHVAAQLKEASCRLESWPAYQDSFEALRPGLTRVYRQARRRMAQAYQQPTAERFHAWRKRVKDHWYHTRLLEPIWPAQMRTRRKALKQLSDFLGDEHDLAVMHAALLEAPDDFGDPALVRTLRALIEHRRGELQSLAHPLGERLFAEKPKAFARRLEAEWATARAGSASTDT